MKRLLSLLPLLAFATLLPTAAIAAPRGTTAVFANARYHQTNETIKDWPFDKGDFSYGLSAAFYDAAGYLELGVNYAPESSLDDVDDVWTPFARIVIEDRFVAAGIGLRGNYISYADGFESEDGSDSDWSSLLYEFYLGVEIPLGSVALGGGAYYTFDKWDELRDFDVDFLEYGVHLGYRF